MQSFHIKSLYAALASANTTKATLSLTCGKGTKDSEKHQHANSYLHYAPSVIKKNTKTEQRLG